MADKKLTAPTNKTLTEEWTEWLAGAKAGEIRKRNGDRYKPAVPASSASPSSNVAGVVQ